MFGTGRDLMDVNGTSRAIEEIHSLQGETIPPVQLGLLTWVVVRQFLCKRKRKSAYAKQFM